MIQNPVSELDQMGKIDSRNVEKLLDYFL